MRHEHSSIATPSTELENGEVHAVMVAFHPEKALFLQALSLLAAQVSCVHVIDNTPGESPVGEWLGRSGIANVDWHALGDNFGIAAALNDGIRRAITQGASYVLLSDQDSLPAPDMVAMLAQSLVVLKRNGHRVGAIGPTYTDLHTGITFPFQTRAPGKFFYQHTVPTKATPFVAVLTLITSGTVIPVEVIREVGLMDESLFIDYVDTEWCHRANHYGYSLFGTLNARMVHRMGDRSLRVWYFGWRSESAYSPVRVYYRVRNFVALCKSTYVPLGVKIRSSWYTLGMIYTQCVFGRTRFRALRMALLGLWHGARGRMGAYSR